MTYSRDIQNNIFELFSVQSLGCVWPFVTPWTAARQASLSITNSWSLLKLMFIELVIPSNRLIICCPLLLPSVFHSNRVFSNEAVLCIRWPKYWSFSISPSNEYSGLISFRMDWFDLLEVHGSCFVATEPILTTPSRSGHTLLGAFFLLPPLPDNTIKLFFTTSPKTVSEV